MGLLQVRQGDLLRAEQYLSAARNDGYDQSRVAYWLVRVCVAAGRYHSALNHAARYLRNDPTNWRLRLVVASIHEALGDLEHTRRDLEFIVRAEPSWPLPHYRLALLYSLDPSGNRRAIQHYEAYLDLDPKGVHAAEVDTLLARARELAAESNAEPPFGVRAESEQLP